MTRICFYFEKNPRYAEYNAKNKNIHTKKEATLGNTPETNINTTSNKSAMSTRTKKTAIITMAETW